MKRVSGLALSCPNPLKLVTRLTGFSNMSIYCRLTLCRSLQRTGHLQRSPNGNHPPSYGLCKITSINRLSFHPGKRRHTFNFSSSASSRASPTKTPASSSDPLEIESQRLIEQGSKLLEKGDVEGASKKYKRSISIKPTSTGYYNLGIALYQLKRHSEAISVWEKSLAESPSADVHNNLASAYILSEPPEPHKALENLKKAVDLDPTDDGHLEDALAEYKQALQLGITRAQQNIRNVGAKLLRKKLSEKDAGDLTHKS
ncbi:hypothetical protein BY996DRAFT_3899399 [Phakopsora pachyrhizi]|nr:hypothetical protein BY996DRAFT_3899399 [Phakopsora pachyrhizi]